jgi:DNA mismatch repair protein MutL
MADGKIKILPESLSNKIAAGEVVDRPSSIVKELVENALDAGATEITVVVRDGGKTLIQVMDNGSGMIESDAILAFERHSTSKIHEADDLHRIETMGFRGEALASIGSVSRVDMRTRTEDSPTATQLTLDGGIMKDVGQTAGNCGTSIAVKNLFFNTPARRKFMKSDRAEYRHILQVMQRYFLSFPEISFHFLKNDEEIYKLPQADLQQRITQVYGEQYGENLVSVDFESGDRRIHGFVGNMDMFRQSRGDQFLFLNRRFIQNKNLNWAVISAYGTILPHGSYPFYSLFLNMDPEHIDVNVHPSKIEVRFEDERSVYGLVHRAVKEALQKGDVVPVLRTQLEQNEPEYETIPVAGKGSVTRPSQSADGFRPARPDLAFPFEFRREKREMVPEPSEEAPQQSPEMGAAPIKGEDAAGHVSVWQLHNKYLFSQIKSGLIIIDQHLAHERILYERALELFNKARPVAQQQLFPQTVELAAQDFDVLLEMQFYLSRLGFVVKEFGKNTVVIEAVPVELRSRNEEKVLREMIDDYKQDKEPDIRERIATVYSCKNAIKAGDNLKQEEIVALIDNLFATQNPYFCPHGRPIIVSVPMEELDRRFLRI